MSGLLSPRYWGGHLLMLVCVGIATGLGFWQLDAWSSHRAAEARDISQADPTPLADVMGGDDRFPGEHDGRPVSLEGRWLADDTVFIANRGHDGRTGYWVVTPVLVDDADSAMPVVRGWSATPEAPALDTDRAAVTGWLQPSEGSGKRDEDPTDDVLPEMRTASLVEKVDEDLYGAFVVTRDDVEAGLEPVAATSIPDVSSNTALRNLLYAIEWWLFAAFAFFIWVRWCRDSLVVDDGERLRSEP